MNDTPLGLSKRKSVEIKQIQENFSAAIHIIIIKELKSWNESRFAFDTS